MNFFIYNINSDWNLKIEIKLQYIKYSCSTLKKINISTKKYRVQLYFYRTAPRAASF